MTSAKHMEMQMKNSLPAVSPRIGHNAIPRFGQPLVRGNLSAGEEQPTEQGLIRFAEVLNCRNMPFGDYQSMNRRLRANVIECQRMLILIHHFSRNTAVNDAAENTVAHTSSLTTARA